MTEPAWPTEIDNRAAKEQIARSLAGRAADGQVIGVGSGSTAFLALVELGHRVARERLHVACIPTSLEIESYCAQLGLPVTTLAAARPDWCFDGADEVDPKHNVIKGRGGAFLREELVFAAAGKRVLLVDQSKFVPRLGVRHPVPLGVVPEGASLVRERLRDRLGAAPTVRPAGGKDGGVMTEEGLVVMDLPIDGSIEPAELRQILLTTPGILATGLFVGYEFEVLS